MLTILSQVIDIPTSLLTEELTVSGLLLVALLFYINKDNKNMEEIKNMREEHKKEVERLQEKLELRLREKESLLDDCEKDLRKEELKYLELRIKKGENEL